MPLKPEADATVRAGLCFLKPFQPTFRQCATQERAGLLIAQRLTEQVIGLAIKVHRLTGPWLLESVYEQCLCYEFHEAGLSFQRQVAIPVSYRGVNIGDGFKADLIVEQAIIV